MPNEEYGWGRIDAFRAILSISHGDANNDGFIANLSDLSSIIAYLTIPEPNKPHMFPSDALGDWNCNGVVDLVDLNQCQSYILYGASAPVKPCFNFILQ